MSKFIIIFFSVRLKKCEKIAHDLFMMIHFPRDESQGKLNYAAHGEVMLRGARVATR